MIQSNNFKVSVVDIMGILDSGISVMLNIEYKGKYYDATYWYNKENSIITVSDDLEDAIQFLFNEIEDYDVILAELDLMFPKALFDETIKELSDVDIDLNKYYEYYLKKLGV